MNLLDRILQLKVFKTSLRIKVLVVFILPMIFVLSVFSYIHNLREQQEITEQIETATIQMGDMALSGMRNAMLNNDREVVDRILQNYGTNPSIAKMQIVNLENRITNSTSPNEQGKILQTDQVGCRECHDKPPLERQRITKVDIQKGVFRVVTPILNAAECQICHSANDKHLGVLLIDAPLEPFAEYTRDEKIYNFSISIASIALVSILAYLMIQWLIERRVRVLYKYLNEFAQGNLSVRIPKDWKTEDEITQLADYFNAIADTLEKDKQLQSELTLVRQEAVAEERDRIARELHDGVAQFIGYVNAKLTAIRLLIQKGEISKANQQLLQVEQAVHEQALDVRSSIIGLKMASESGTGLITGLHQLVEQFKRLSEFEIQIEIDPQMKEIDFEPEINLHLLRIVQEAMSNTRKHASADQVIIYLGRKNDSLILETYDDGVGFVPYRLRENKHARFGISNMYERAELIGATLMIDSEPGQGTTVTVQLRIEED